MPNGMLINLAALAALIPASLVPLRLRQERDGLFWGLLALAVFGPCARIAFLLDGSWQTNLSVTLWVAIAVSMILFAALALTTREAWRLTPLLLPYLAFLGLFALIGQSVPGKALAAEAPKAWLQIHILISVVTYGLLTVGAVAALAAALQERALKKKRPTGLTKMLPSVADSENLSQRLLAASALVLGLGLATGMATQYLETGRFLLMDHKNLLSIAAFLVIVGLLAGIRLTGLRGRIAARILLTAYLLLSLGYLGVKFVRDVLLG